MLRFAPALLLTLALASWAQAPARIGWIGPTDKVAGLFNHATDTYAYV